MKTFFPQSRVLLRTQQRGPNSGVGMLTLCYFEFRPPLGTSITYLSGCILGRHLLKMSFFEKMAYLEKGVSVGFLCFLPISSTLGFRGCLTQPAARGRFFLLNLMYQTHLEMQFGLNFAGLY